jgi:hypothetical protein
MTWPKKKKRVVSAAIYTSLRGTPAASSAEARRTAAAPSPAGPGTAPGSSPVKGRGRRTWGHSSSSPTPLESRLT